MGELASWHPMPKDAFAGEPGLVTLATSIPGFAALWDKQVPAKYIDAEGSVACPDCGSTPAIRLHQLFKCNCGRYFLRLRDGIRVHHFKEATDG